MTRYENGFTLIELLTVIIIIGILAALAIPNFNKTRERAIDKDAQSALQMIQAAERIYNFRYNSYYPNPAGTVSNLNTINSNLSLSLSGGTNWDYNITSSGSPPNAFSAYALRVGGTRQWMINQTLSNATCVTGCI